MDKIIYKVAVIQNRGEEYNIIFQLYTFGHLYHFWDMGLLLRV